MMFALLTKSDTEKGLLKKQCCFISSLNSSVLVTLEFIIELLGYARITVFALTLHIFFCSLEVIL